MREVLKEAQNCRDFFERGGFADYFDSLNECYFDNKGVVESPQITIVDYAQLQEQEGDSDGEESFELSRQPDGGIGISLSCEKETKQGFAVNTNIILTLRYSTRYNLYVLSLYAYAGNDSCHTENPVLVGRYTQKTFFLNPNGGAEKHIDDLLLTFTSELIDARILEV